MGQLARNWCPLGCVGAVGFEPTVYRSLQLQCLIIHAAVSSNSRMFDHWSLSPCLAAHFRRSSGLRPLTILRRELLRYLSYAGRMASQALLGSHPANTVKQRLSGGRNSLLRYHVSRPGEARGTRRVLCRSCDWESHHEQAKRSYDGPRLQGFPPWTTWSGSLEPHFSRNPRSSFLFLRLSGSITGISSMIG